MNTDKLTTIAGLIAAAAQAVKAWAPEYAPIADTVSAIALLTLGYFTNKGPRPA